MPNTSIRRTTGNTSLLAHFVVTVTSSVEFVAVADNLLLIVVPAWVEGIRCVHVLGAILHLLWQFTVYIQTLLLQQIHFDRR